MPVLAHLRRLGAAGFAGEELLMATLGAEEHDRTVDHLARGRISLGHVHAADWVNTGGRFGPPLWDLDADRGAG